MRQSLVMAVTVFRRVYSGLNGLIDGWIRTWSEYGLEIACILIYELVIVENFATILGTLLIVVSCPLLSMFMQHKISSPSNWPDEPKSPPPRRKKPISSRPIISCEECRRRKIGCSKTSSCNNCIRFGRECVYVNQDLGRGRLSDRRPRHVQPINNSSQSPSMSSSRAVHGSALEYTEENLSPQQDTTGLGISGYKPGFKLELNDFCLRIGRLSIARTIGGVSRLELPNIVSIIQLLSFQSD